MRLSRLLPATLREEPSGNLPTGYKRLIRAGYLRVVGADVVLLPLGLQLVTRVSDSLAEGLTKGGWAQILVPPGGARPANELSAAIGASDWTGAPPSSVLTALVDSYKRLPLKAFQLGWGQRTQQDGEPFPSASRLTLQAWALSDPSQAGSVSVELVEGLMGVLEGLGLDPVTSRLATGSDAVAEVALRTSAHGPEMLGCGSCGFLARPTSIAIAAGMQDASPLLPLDRVATPGADSIPGLCRSLGISPEQTAKVMMFAGKPPGETADQALMILVRGERDVSWQKVGWATGWRDLRRAEASEVDAIGAVGGFASPIGLDHRWVLVDHAIAQTRNLVAGANKPGYHLLNSNCGRDYSPWLVADLVVARPGDPCPRCGAGLASRTGVLVACCTPLQPLWSHLIGSFANRSGEMTPLGGVYLAMDVTTAIGVLAGEQADDRGLAWKPEVAPFAVQIIGMSAFETKALEICAALEGQGIGALLDDRDLSPGVKLKDADLIGLPVRVIVGEKSVASGGVEITFRRSGKSQIAPLEAIGAEIQKLIR